MKSSRQDPANPESSVFSKIPLPSELALASRRAIFFAEPLISQTERASSPPQYSGLFRGNTAWLFRE
jgi:hypothetical protein